VEAIAAVNHLFAVGGVSGVHHLGTVLGQQLWTQGGHVQGEELEIGGVPFGGKQHIFAIPAPAEGIIGSRVPGELAGGSPFNRDRENVPIAVTLAAEHQPAAVRGEHRIGIRLDVVDHRPGFAVGHAGDPNVTAIDEGDLVARRAEGGHPRAGDFG
jgi:hypothetical protein